MSGEQLNLVFTRGSIRRMKEDALIEIDGAYVLKMLKEANADMLFVGYSYKSYHRTLETTDGKFKHGTNFGSIGKLKMVILTQSWEALGFQNISFLI